MCLTCHCINCGKLMQYVKNPAICVLCMSVRLLLSLAYGRGIEKSYMAGCCSIRHNRCGRNSCDVFIVHVGEVASFIGVWKKYWSRKILHGIVMP